ncbi:MAG: hypothetical protein J0H19_02615 [Rhodospirillales bacterium]|nr:hypothetical protein [Rhodospirillales bacterium]MBN8925497.1 hypothetical protein [Rhodospirillales bacterium]
MSDAAHRRQQAAALRSSAGETKSATLRDLLIGMADALESRELRAQIDQRGQGRVPTSGVWARLSAGRRTKIVPVVNLAIGGAGIEGDVPWPVGAEVAFELLDHDLSAPARVMWAGNGMAGLLFFHSPESRLAINHLLARLRRSPAAGDDD